MINIYHHPYLKKLFLPFLSVLILLAGLGVSLKIVRQRQTATKASTNLVDLLISAPASVNPNQEFTSIISVDPHAYKVTAVDLKINVSSNLQIMSIQPGTYLSTILSPAVISGNSVHIVLGSGTTPVQGGGILATLTLKAKSDASGTAQVTIEPGTEIAGIDTNGSAVPTSILGDAGQIVITISSPTPTPPTTSNPFGIMTWGDNNSTKMQIATDLGAKYFRPLSVFLDKDPLSCSECQAAIDKGFKLALTIRVNGGRGVPTVPPTDWNAYRDILSQVLDKYQPEILVIENEENSNTFYTGTAQEYLQELTVGCEIAHSKNIKCTNGGLVSKLVVVLVSDSYQPDANKADDYLRRALTPEDYDTVSGSVGSPQWLAQIQKGKGLLAGYKIAGADFVNFHWHQENAETLPEAVTYLGSTSQGLPVINNEISPQKSISVNQVTSFMQKVFDLNLPYAVWYSNDSDGVGGPTALTNEAGIPNDSGRAYQQFISDHFHPSTMTLQTSIKFQGVTTQRPDKSVSIEIKQQNNSLYNNSVNFISDSSGKYTANFSPNLSPGTYDIYIKGPVHLRKKFPSISLITGTNNLDFSATMLKTGDIDGYNKVDTTDYSLMLLNFNPTLVQNVTEDINFDNKVDTTDYSLMLLNFNPLVGGD
ncbi:MAG: hypothetical protein UU93_C0007G0027 [Candidatus Amesbacteria bacterium GW2011_GWA2_42_12]|uniref:Cohesin domain-containing protein n=1 Tax=Candidatus Amesbacteria bacterium GW2011_GWA2_42_12 TaxID=1618356 RepID=A0A0G0Y6T1_9BACT|nr:MAG: hypothetical protein UU93_C0007G0027 [Candidatus Amesbacteria bacterium GW2011_GWA2_42_12]